MPSDPHAAVWDAHPLSQLIAVGNYHIIPPQRTQILAPPLPCSFLLDTHLHSLKSGGTALAWEAHQAALHCVCLRAQHGQGWHPGDPREVPQWHNPS